MRPRPTRAPRTLLLTLVLAAAGPLAAQGQLPRWRQDPYTRNDPKLMADLGYVSYGPFRFGNATTEEIDRHVSYDRILWVETAHFRFGSALQAWDVPLEPDTKSKLREELLRLKKKLPQINEKPRQLDPWLRLHLFAMRLEEHYAQLQEWLGVTDADFPGGVDKVVRGQGRYMGQGPYLGQPDKYLVLLFEKEGSYQDYVKRFVGRVTKFGQRWNFKEQGSLFYGVAADMEGGRLRHDTAVHANTIFNVTHNLIDGYRFYAYDLPVWIKVGLAHYFERKISPKWNSFDMNEASLADMRPLWRWEQEARKLVSGDKGTPLSEAYTWRDYSQIEFNDHILIWSRWDYLMGQGKEKFAAFMLDVKGRVTADWLPDQNDLVGATREALQKHYSLSPLTFDLRWKEWVLKTYPAQ
ncbi:MAG: hypothetical protein IT458_15560 [Planctomycetes bacterium]|nr:hypothetical protein [Planctomycetota bacterium]